MINKLKEIKIEIHTRYMVNRILGRGIVRSLIDSIKREIDYRKRGRLHW